ncbi:MAG: IMP cyclohydrolase [Anaerolineae bacterium]
MYIGRFVLAGRTTEGARYLGYRVSSRSFPNRRIALVDGGATVLPTADARPSDNPYIAYNCLRSSGQTTVIANGSHVDPVIEKVGKGYPVRDALALTLLALDYEHDSLNTPRIAAAWEGDTAYIAIITVQKLLVQSLDLLPSTAMLIATYELTVPTSMTLTSRTAGALAHEIYGLSYEHPVASLATILTDPPVSATAGPGAA